MNFLKRILVIIGILSAFSVVAAIIDAITISPPILNPITNLHPVARFLLTADGYFLFFLMGLIPFVLLFLLSKIKGLKFLFRGKAVNNLIAFNVILLIVLYIIIPIERTRISQKSLIGILLSIAILLSLVAGYVALRRLFQWTADRLNHRLKKIAGTGIISLGFLLIVAGLVVRIFLSIVPLQGGDDQRPNVIIISIDTLRKDHLPCYGYEGCQTPNIDQFSEKCVVFENCIAPAPHTVPSMASMLTGFYPTAHGCRFEPSIPINDEVTTLSEILQHSGYHTESYTANPLLSPERGFSRGFDYYEDFFFTKDLRYLLPKRVHEVAEDVLIFVGVEDRIGFLDTTEWLRSKAAARLAKLKKYSPFFAWFHFLDPHFPFFPPKNYIPAEAEDRERIESIKYELFDLEDDYSNNKDQVWEIVKLYDGEIQYLDYALGDLFEIMEEEGILENTIIVFTADHGEEFWEHDEFGHGHCLYPEVIRIPLFIYLPPSMGCISGRISGYVSLVDVAPIILECLGLPQTYGMQGSSLAPLIESLRNGSYENDFEGVSRSVFSEFIIYPKHRPEKKGAYLDNYHLIYNLMSQEIELYDLSSDPTELVDISTEDEAAKEKLYSELMEWYEANQKIAEQLSPQKEIEMSEEEKEMLRGLGYIISD